MNGPLRFPDEFGRHKALDLIGELALVGGRCWRAWKPKSRPRLHTQLVTRLLADPSLWTETYDEAPEEPRNPHAEPFLGPAGISPAISPPVLSFPVR